MPWQAAAWLVGLALAFGVAGMMFDGKEGFFKGVVGYVSLLALILAIGWWQDHPSDEDCQTGPGGAEYCYDPAP